VIPLEALRSREGAAYLGGAAVAMIAAALLTASTLLRFMHEEDLREAFGAAARDEGTAGNLLSKLRQGDPKDVDVRVALGCIESERGEEDAARLDVADKLFAEALALDPTREAALVGQCANHLRMAMAATPEGRAVVVDQANELLKSVPDGADHDALEAAILILRGKPQDALKKLDAPVDGPMSLAAMRAHTWNRAVAAILMHDGRALELALPAYLMRPQQLPGEWNKPAEAPEFTGPRTDPSRMLAAAYRVSLVGAGGAPDVMTARCAMARHALASRHEAGLGLLPGRFQPAGRDLGAGWNALGIALLRLGKMEEAAEAFHMAASISTEPAYDFNYGDALYRQAMALPEDDPRRGNLFLTASTGYDAALNTLKRPGQEARGATRAFAATNCAMLVYLAGSPRDAAGKLAAMDDKDFTDLGRRYRNLGAFYDMAMMGRDAVIAYKKAVELGAPDGEKMQVRIRVWEARQGRR
jgi:tetratricopeptide (TPR) repeat protein